MNPRGNVLVVHVVSARNLHIRTQKALDVYISLAISGNGPWKSKVTTNTLRLDADSNARGELHTWDEHCEFQLNDMDTKLVAHVNHKTLLGTTETLGELVLTLEAMARFQPPVWFALAKPGNGNGGERGQIQLGYQFTSSSPNSATTSLVAAKSVSSMSLNKIEKEKKFDRIRRKMQQQFSRRSSTKRASVVDDAQSLASVSIAGGAINYNSGSRSSLSSTTNSAALAFSSPTPSEQRQQNGIPINSNTKAVDGHNHHVHYRHQDDAFSVHSSATNDLDSHQQQQQLQQQSNSSFRSSEKS
uniref:C2 domain-containing protein n=1 Tax=Globodera rostochiensis TaxID=31243 RepID=A0A914HGB2_GLORO